MNKMIGIFLKSYILCIIDNTIIFSYGKYVIIISYRGILGYYNKVQQECWYRYLFGAE